jgi:hypothetical protein
MHGIGGEREHFQRIATERTCPMDARKCGVLWLNLEELAIEPILNRWRGNHYRTRFVMT